MLTNSQIFIACQHIAWYWCRNFVRLSVRLSRSGVVSKWLNISSYFFSIKQEIRSAELGVCPVSNATLFHFWSRDVHPVQNLLLCTKFHQSRMIFRWDMAIYRFSKWRPSAILELFYLYMRPPTKSLLLAATACQISCQSDTQIWRYSYLNFSHIWLEMLPKIGFLGDFGPLSVIIHHSRPPKGTSLRTFASFKLSTVKIRWEVWPVYKYSYARKATQLNSGMSI